ncbi:MAG: sugar phosphate isomerase/epimerase [Clostridia bacterium]|nr:sugar phosphate isomerase/epimerase [Clostridia bacterium]
MRIAINAKLFQIKDEQFLKALKGAGFDGIDLDLSSAKSLFEGDVENRSKELRAHLDENGIECSQVHLPYYSLFASSELWDTETDEKIEKSFTVMKILGAKWGAFHPLTAFNFSCDSKRAIADNREKLLRYLKAAEREGVGIAVENIPIFPDCPQYKFFSANPDDHIMLVDSIKSDFIGVCWDFGHANLMTYDMCEALDKMGDRIKILHMHSNFGDYDRHLCPYIGSVEFDKLLPILKKNGFDGTLSLEINYDLIRPQILPDYLNMCAKAARDMTKYFR